MTPRWWPDVAGLAEDQSGLFTTAQAQALGATRPALGQMVKSDAIERILHGVYLVAGAPVDRFMSLRAAWLSLDPQRTAAERLANDPAGVVTHRSASFLLGIGELDADRHEFTTSERKRTRNPDVQIHQGAAGEWMVHEGIPVTAPAQTIATLARSGLDLDHLASVVVDATRRWGTSRVELRAALDPVAQRYGHDDVDDLLDDLLVDRGHALQATAETLGALGTDRLVRGIVEQILATVPNPAAYVPTLPVPSLPVPTLPVPNFPVPNFPLPSAQIPSTMKALQLPGVDESVRRMLANRATRDAIQTAFRALDQYDPGDEDDE